MLHDTVRAALREPCFEPPPRLTVPRERRLTAIAARALAEGGSAHAFRDNAVSIARARGGDLIVAERGDAVAAVFGLPVGRLGGPPDSLASVLLAAVERARDSGAVTPFEAAVATTSAACVLLRGVVLPTVSGADAVLSWKQVLDDEATARIRAELLREHARMCQTPRAGVFD